MEHGPESPVSPLEPLPAEAPLAPPPVYLVGPPSSRAPAAPATPAQIAERIRAVLAPAPAPVLAPAPASVVAPEPAPVVAPEPARLAAPEPARLAAPEPAPFRPRLRLRAPAERAAVRRTLAAVGKRSAFVYASFTFHVLIFTCLGLFRIATDTDLLDGLLGPKPVVPPVHRVRLRESEPPRLDLDRGLRAAKPIDLWNTPGDGLGGIFREGAELSDHDESADGEDFGKLKGGGITTSDGAIFNGGATSGKPGWGGKDADAEGVRAAAMGVGEGPGTPRFGRLGSGTGARASRVGTGSFGGRRNLLARGGGSDATERAVGAALRWLARHQGVDGSWSMVSGSRCKTPEKCGHECQSRVGVTGLAVMAFLDAGYTPRTRTYFRDEVTGEAVSVADVVGRGLRWLSGQQRSDADWDAAGHLVKPGAFTGGLYEDAIGVFALADAATRMPTDEGRRRAQLGVHYLEAAHNVGQGWRYSFQSGDNDASVTAWCVLALRQGQRAHLEVRADVLDDAAQYIESLTNEVGYVGYTGREAYSNGDRLANTASGALCRSYAKSLPGETKTAVLELLGTAGPPVMADPYSCYYATLALYTIDGPAGPTWRSWNDRLTKTLLKDQHGPGEECAAGSWGSDSYTTALHALTLEVYYRYAPQGTVSER